MTQRSLRFGDSRGPIRASVTTWSSSTTGRATCGPRCARWSAPGRRSTLTADRHAAEAADGLVVPGVGRVRRVHGRAARASTGRASIGRRLAGGRPVLGICVGMQVLFERGVEHGVETEGCDEWPGVVERLQAPVVPHMGWNTVEVPDGLAAVRRAWRASGSTSSTPTPRGPGTCVTDGHTAAPLVTWAEHGGDRFVSAVENGPLAATQFHPEKSGDAGAALLRNWVEPCDPLGCGAGRDSRLDRGSLHFSGRCNSRSKRQEPVRRGARGTARPRREAEAAPR